MESNYKEVRFDIYCPACKYRRVMEIDEPCNTCLETGAREGTEKPEQYERDPKR